MQINQPISIYWAQAKLERQAVLWVFEAQRMLGSCESQAESCLSKGLKVNHPPMLEVMPAGQELEGKGTTPNEG